MQAFLYLVPVLYILYVVCISFIRRRPKLYSGDEKGIYELAKCLWFLSLFPNFFLSFS